MKIVFSRFLILLVVFFVSINTAFAFGDEDDEDEEISKPKASVEEQTRYTTTNIWYQKPGKILILFHAGAMLPVGTKITLGDMNRKALKFKDENGTKFRIFTRKYYNLTGPKMAKLLFSKKDPLAKGGQFHKFSKMEQKQIKLGRIKKGMSKQAVIMAYGHPPTHVNPSIESDTWQLWKTRWNKLRVTFEDGKVIRILD